MWDQTGFGYVGFDMILILSFLSVCTTTITNRPVAERPMVTSLFSPLTTEDSIVIALRSPNMVVASSNEMPCFLRFDRALEASHSKSRLIQSFYHRRWCVTRGNLGTGCLRAVFEKRKLFIARDRVHPTGETASYQSL